MQLVFLSCGKETYTPGEYLKFVNDPSSGYVRERKVDDKTIRVKYLSPEYLVLQELKDTPTAAPQVKDSLTRLYSGSRTFFLTIGMEEQGGKDIMMGNVSSYDEYVELSREMNFNLENYLRLKTETREYVPAIVSLENTYGLQKHRGVYIVFTAESSGADLLSSEELDLVFNDEIFNTGINHFSFSKKEIDRKISIQNNK